jgi:hypothetical protein
MLTKCHSYKNIFFIEFIVKSKPKNSINFFFDKFDKLFEKWTLNALLYPLTQPAPTPNKLLFIVNLIIVYVLYVEV